MAELTLKDESVLQIGKSVANSFEGLASSGKAMLIGPPMPMNNDSDISGDNVPATSGDNVPVTMGGDNEPEMEKPASIGIFESIREKISEMVSVLSANFAFDKKVAAEDDVMDRVEQAQDTEMGKEDEGPGMLAKIGDSFKSKFAALGESAKEKTKALAGGLGSMLMKGGLIFGLLLLAKGLQKYGKEIAEKLTPIVDGIKAFFSAFMDDIGPLFNRAIDIIKTAFGGLADMFKGLFTGDASMFIGGVKKIFFDLPIKLMSYIGDAFFTLIENALAAFGIESEMVTNIKLAFRKLPEAIQGAIDAAVTFITETIPQFFTDMKDAVVDKAKSIVTSIKTFFTDAFDSIKNTFTETIEGIGNFFSNIGDKIKTVINGAIDALPLPQFIKDKLKFETKADKEAGAMVSETGGLEKYKTEGIDPGKRQAMTGGGVTGEEALAEVKGEQYTTSKVSKAGTSGYDQAFGIMTADQYKEFEKIKDVDQQIAYLKNLNDAEQERRQMILDEAEKQKEFNKKMDALKPEFGGEIVGPDDQMLKDDKNLRGGVTGKDINTESANMNSSSAGGDMNINKGGNTNVTTANNTYTTILEDTNTSDGGLRNALSA